jgi:hypothetical protein
VITVTDAAVVQLIRAEARGAGESGLSGARSPALGVEVCSPGRSKPMVSSIGRARAERLLIGESAERVCTSACRCSPVMDDERDCGRGVIETCLGGSAGWSGRRRSRGPIV